MKMKIFIIIISTLFFQLSLYCQKKEFKGKIIVQQISLQNNLFDTTIVDNSDIRILAQTVKNDTFSIGKVNADGSFKVKIDTSKYEFILFKLSKNKSELIIVAESINFDNDTLIYLYDYTFDPVRLMDNRLEGPINKSVIISGLIVDENYTHVIDVSVRLKNDTVWTQTNENGNFTLKSEQQTDSLIVAHQTKGFNSYLVNGSNYNLIAFKSDEIIKYNNNNCKYQNKIKKTRVIRGVVLDVMQEVVPGVIVSDNTSLTKTLTNDNGKFTLNVLESSDSIIINYDTGNITFKITSDTMLLVLPSDTSDYRIIDTSDYRRKKSDSIRIIETYTAKPAIYLYPTQTDTISIKLDFRGTLGTTYPKYTGEWKVLATPNGELTNLSDNRKYNYLFWDGIYNFPISHFDYKSGFVVAKNDLDKFLIEKLSLIGLNNTEVNDFVVYWLPMLEKNEYNLIHFFINDNIDGSAFLNVKPKPDSEIRIFMEFKAVDKNYKITPQQLPSIPRKGFTLVEWGGGIIGDGKIQ